MIKNVCVNNIKLYIPFSVQKAYFIARFALKTMKSNETLPAQFYNYY